MTLKKGASKRIKCGFQSSKRRFWSKKWVKQIGMFFNMKFSLLIFKTNEPMTLELLVHLMLKFHFNYLLKRKYQVYRWPMFMLARQLISHNFIYVWPPIEPIYLINILKVQPTKVDLVANDN